MIDQVNDLIEVNLRILYTAKNNVLNLRDFRDQTGAQIKDPKGFVRLLRIKKLVFNPSDDIHSYQLTAFGKEICENGGWLQQVQRQNKKRNEIRSEKLEIEPQKINSKFLKGFFYNYLFQLHKQIPL